LNDIRDPVPKSIRLLWVLLSVVVNVKSLRQILLDEFHGLGQLRLHLGAARLFPIQPHRLDDNHRGGQEKDGGNQQ
jgi:hypothetical protein